MHFFYAKILEKQNIILKDLKIFANTNHYPTLRFFLRLSKDLLSS